MKSKHIVFFTLISLVVSIALNACRKGFDSPQPLDDCISDINENATPYLLNIPPFFPPMDIPSCNPLTVEGIELGRHLFWDKMLSGDNTMSCGTCHIPSSNFSDPEQYSMGITGEVGNRQAMPLINLGWSPEFFWDGRAHSLEEQVVGPVANPIEMNQDWDELLQELQAADKYPQMYKDAFGSPVVTKARTAKALASFLRTMISAESKFDKQRIGQYTFTESEERGLDLFLKEGGDPANGLGGQFGADCFHCHGFGVMLTTDNLPHNNGLDATFEDLGYGGVTGNALDMGKFRTPTLRNIEFSAPYMHDGRFATLEEVIEHYNSGGVASATIDPFMKYTSGGLELSAQDKEDLIAFLLCFSDTTFMSNPAFQAPDE
jgi:cytochrome c peroxidase